MSRQERRKAQRQAEKKVGQLISVRNEMLQGNKTSQNYKSLYRLQDELMDMGVIKRPGKIRQLFGRIRATFRAYVPRGRRA